MREYNFCAWRSAPDAAFLAAVARAAGVGETELAVLDTWNFVNKTDPMAPDVEAPQASVYVEWVEIGEAAVSCQIRIFGPAIREDEGEPVFARRLARESSEPLLFSDCHIYPNTWMMAREDGAIVHVVVRDDDAMTLLPDNPADPDYWERDVLFAPDAPLPPTTAAGLDARIHPPERCKFGGRCPKKKFVCPAV
jgi:hypothetical protein